jgi:hypothetical protein
MHAPHNSENADVSVHQPTSVWIVSCAFARDSDTVSSRLRYDRLAQMNDTVKLLQFSEKASGAMFFGSLYDLAQHQILLKNEIDNNQKGSYDVQTHPKQFMLMR